MAVSLAAQLQTTQHTLLWQSQPITLLSLHVYLVNALCSNVLSSPWREEHFCGNSGGRYLVEIKQTAMIWYDLMEFIVENMILITHQ